MLENFISSYVDVAPNEYITKYAFNRNFEKLISNDILLYTEISSNENKLYVQTYNTNREYKFGDLVLYKLRKDSTSLYLLSSIQTPNLHKPLVKQNAKGDLVVVNGNYWRIVGLKDNIDKDSSRKDDAEEWIYYKEKIFKQNHEENEDIHPTGKISQKDSTLLFSNMDNINEDQKNFMFPYKLESIIGDDFIQSGYIRKWENGLLEYDLIYKFGKVSDIKDGNQTIISVNTLIPTVSNKNYLYFKDSKDYNIFNQPGKYYVNTSESKQVGLNKFVNVYEAKLEFPEPFKDLNYMVFGSQIKQIETEAYNSTIDIIEDYDSRLVIKGLAITSVDLEASFKYPLSIPNEIVNIQQEALAYIEETNGYPLCIEISSDANIVNIDAYAFYSSKMSQITIPYTTRYIGEQAFGACEKLLCIDIYIENKPSKQPKIHLDAFKDCPNLSIIHFHYRPTLFSNTNMTDDERERIYSDDIDIYDKFSDIEFRALYGIKDVEIKLTGKTFSTPVMTFASSNLYSSNDLCSVNYNNIQNEIDDNYITININDFRNELNGIKNPKFSTSLMFSSSDDETCSLTDYLYINDKQLTGFNSILSDQYPGGKSPIELIVNDEISSILQNALSGCNGISSLTFNNGISVAPSAIIDSRFNVFNLYGSKNILDCSCLINTYIDSMSVDMTDSYLCIYFGLSSELTTIYFNNLSGAAKKTSTNTCGLALSSFEDIYTRLIYCNNAYSEISSSFENSTHKCLPVLGDGTIISTNLGNSDVRYAYYGNISSIPSFFKYKNKTNNLTATDFSYLVTTDINDIVIPFITEQIQLTSVKPANNDDQQTQLEYIYIPNTIYNIGNSAFMGNKSVSEIEFQSGSKISALGTDCFKNCSALTSLTIK